MPIGRKPWKYNQGFKKDFNCVVIYFWNNFLIFNANIKAWAWTQKEVGLIPWRIQKHL